MEGLKRIVKNICDFVYNVPTRENDEIAVMQAMNSSVRATYGNIFGYKSFFYLKDHIAEYVKNKK